MADNGNRLRGTSVPGLRFSMREDSLGSGLSDSKGGPLMFSFYAYFTEEANDSTTTPNNIFFSIKADQAQSVYLRYWIGRPGYLSGGQLPCRVHYIEEKCVWENTASGYEIMLSSIDVQYVDTTLYTPANPVVDTVVDPTNDLNKPFLHNGRIKFRKRFNGTTENPVYVRGLAQTI